MFLSVVAWQTKDTSLQPADAKGFIVEIQKKYVEVQAIKKKGNHRDLRGVLPYADYIVEMEFLRRTAHQGMAFRGEGRCV